MRKLALRIMPVACRIVLFSVLSCLAALAPLAARAEMGRFAILSDTHVGGLLHSAYPDVMKTLTEEGIETVIHAGDAINSPGNVSQWEEFIAETGPGKTLHIAPGNHDIKGEQSLETFRGFFGAPYSSFSDGDTLFILLDTEAPGSESRIDGAQLAWLAAELARPFRYKLVFLHEPLYPAVPHHGLDRHKEARDALHFLFVRYGVALVVAGHDHIYERMTKDGVPYVICGRLGGKPWPTKNGKWLGYIVAERKGPSWAFTVTGVDGREKDSFTVTRPIEAVPPGVREISAPPGGPRLAPTDPVPPAVQPGAGR